MNWESAKKQLKAAGPFAVTGAFLGSTGFLVVEYLDGSDMSISSLLLGAGVGALVGGGMGMLVNAARDQRIENYTRYVKQITYIRWPSRWYSRFDTRWKYRLFNMRNYNEVNKKSKKFL